MTVREAIKHEIERRREGFPAWFGCHPVISVPLDAVFIDDKKDRAYILMEALERAFGECAADTKEG